MKISLEAAPFEAANYAISWRSAKAGGGVYIYICTRLMEQGNEAARACDSTPVLVQ